MKSFFPDAHALIVGVPNEGLTRTVNDARWVYETLIDENVCGYHPKRVALHSLRSKTGGVEVHPATRTAVLDALAAAADKIPESGSFLFYFSGHGAPASRPPSAARSHHIILAGYGKTDKARGSDEAFEKCAISAGELKQALAKIRAKRKVIILDCCFAAGICEVREPWVSYGQAKTLTENEIRELDGQSGSFVLGASPHNQPAFECTLDGLNELRFSVFTYALTKAFRGEGQHRRDGVVWFSELAGYVCSEVGRITGGRQNPMFDFAGATNFGIAYYKRLNTEKRIPLPRHLAAEPNDVSAQDELASRRPIDSDNKVATVAIVPGVDLLPLLYPANFVAEMRSGYFPVPKLIYDRQHKVDTLKATPSFERFDQRLPELVLNGKFQRNFSYTPLRRRMPPMLIEWSSETRLLRFTDPTRAKTLGLFTLIL